MSDKVNIEALWTYRLRQIADNSAAYGTDSALSKGAVSDAEKGVADLCAEVERLRTIEAAAREFVEARAHKEALYASVGPSPEYSSSARACESALSALESALAVSR